MEDFFQFPDRFLLIRPAYAVHTVQGPGKIDCRGTGGIQVFFCFLKCRIELVKCIGLNLFCRQVNTDGSSHADGRSPSHLQQINGVPYIFLFCQFQYFRAVREFCLVYDDQGAFLFIQRHCLIIHNGFRFAHGDPPFP